MTNSYPFVVSVDEFKGKRVLVTGGTKGTLRIFLIVFALPLRQHLPLATPVFAWQQKKLCKCLTHDETF
jgi:hypothetical protein